MNRRTQLGPGLQQIKGSVNKKKNGYYLLLHDFINLNQERKISPHLRESGEVHPGVNGILRRKKACPFQHFLEKNQENPTTNHDNIFTSYHTCEKCLF